MPDQGDYVLPFASNMKTHTLLGAPEYTHHTHTCPCSELPHTVPISLGCTVLGFIQTTLFSLKVLSQYPQHPENENQM